VGVAEKVFKVRGQRSKVRGQGHDQTNVHECMNAIMVWRRDSVVTF